MTVAMHLALALASCTMAAHSQPADYPAPSIRIVVPHAVGGAADALARGVAERLASALGKPVAVDNKPGASGIIGAQACATAPADGSVLCMTNNDVVSTNPVLFNKLPYDPGQFVPVAAIATLDAVLVANVKSPGGFREMLAAVKARPESLKIGTFGPGSVSDIYSEWLARTQGARFLSVHYRGAGPALTAVLAGEVDLIVFQAGGAAPYVKDGRLKVVAELGPTRSKIFPEAPTFAEMGLPLAHSAWVGLFAPPRTPQPLAERVHAEVNRILQDPAVVQKVFAAQSAEPIPMSRAQFGEFLKRENESQGRAVRASGIQLEQ